jgi:hypothetical protein
MDVRFELGTISKTSTRDSATRSWGAIRVLSVSLMVTTAMRS